VEIGDNAVDGDVRIAEERKRGGAILRGPHAVAERGCHLLQYLAHGGIVVDDEDRLPIAAQGLLGR